MLTVREHETLTLVKQDGFTGTLTKTLIVYGSSQMLVSLHVNAIDPGATARVIVRNAFSEDVPYQEVRVLTLTAVNQINELIAPFHNRFEFQIDVMDGNADIAVGVSVHDNAYQQFFDTEVNVALTDVANELGRFDAVRVGDGTGAYLDVNEDGSINVVVIDSADISTVNEYGEAPAVSPGAEISVVTYTIPPNKSAMLFRAEASGENIARYQVTVNDVVVATRRTHHGSGLSTNFEFTAPSKFGIPLQAGDVVKLNVLHGRPDSGDFEGRLQAVLKDAA